MNVLESMKFIITNFFRGVWDLLKSIDVGSGIAYTSVILGFLALTFVLSKFWKFGGGD